VAKFTKTFVRKAEKNIILRSRFSPSTFWKRFFELLNSALPTASSLEQTLLRACAVFAKSKFVWFKKYVPDNAMLERCPRFCWSPENQRGICVLKFV
jgi:hypothetical protein